MPASLNKKPSTSTVRREDHAPPTGRTISDPTDVAVPLFAVLGALLGGGLCLLLVVTLGSDFTAPETERFDQATQSAAERAEPGMAPQELKTILTPRVPEAQSVTTTTTSILATGYSQNDAPAAARGIRAVIDFTVTPGPDSTSGPGLLDRIPVFRTRSEEIHVCRIVTLTPATPLGLDDAQGELTTSVDALDPGPARYSVLSWRKTDLEEEAWARTCDQRLADVNLDTSKRLNFDDQASTLQRVSHTGDAWSGVIQLEVQPLQIALENNAGSGLSAQERLRAGLDEKLPQGATRLGLATTVGAAAAAWRDKTGSCVNVWAGPSFHQIWSTGTASICSAEEALRSVPQPR